MYEVRIVHLRESSPHYVFTSPETCYQRHLKKVVEHYVLCPPLGKLRTQIHALVYFRRRPEGCSKKSTEVAAT